MKIHSVPFIFVDNNTVPVHLAGYADKSKISETSENFL